MIQTIKVPDSVTVRSAVRFAGSLLEAARPGCDVTIDMDAMVECDLSFVQLVLSLRTHLEGAGATLSLTRPAGPILCALLDRAGFGAPTPADNAFWFHGERPQ